MRILAALLLTCLPLWAQMPQRVMQDLLAVAGTPVPSEAAAWTPASESGLTFWFKSDDATISLLNDGDRVQTWTDQSGNGRDVIQMTETNKPEYKAAMLNGKPGLLFTNATAVMTTASTYNGRQLFSQYSGTLVIVTATNICITVGGDAYYWVYYASYGSGENLQADNSYYNGSVFLNSGGTFSVSQTPNARPATHFHLSMTNGVQVLYTNGVSAKTDDGTINFTTSAATMNIGTDARGAHNCVSYIAFCEIIGWDHNLDETAVTALNAYIKSRYDLGP